MSLRVMTQGGGTGGASASIFVTGLSETDTVTATKGGKTVKGKWVQKPLLPDGYTQLEYIESTGTQYIDTGVKLKPNESVLIKFLPTATPQDDKWFAGSFVSNDERFHAGFYQNAWFTGDGFSYNTNESVYTASGQSAHSHTTNFYLFKCNGLSGVLPVRICFAEIGNHGEFIPAKRNSDGEIGTYDLVNGVFHTNAGTGTFIAGPEIPSTIDGHEITIKSFGMWTVTATNGEDTAMQDVLVDAAVEFEIEMGYILWLYRDGDECEDVTGGWVAKAFANYGGYSGIVYTENADNLEISIATGSTSGYWRKKGFASQNAIDLAEFNTLKIRVSVASHGTNCVVMGTVVSSLEDDNHTSSFLKYETVKRAEFLEAGLYEIDISEITDAQYVAFYGVKGTSSDGALAQITEIWLE